MEELNIYFSTTWRVVGLWGSLWGLCVGHVKILKLRFSTRWFATGFLSPVRYPLWTWPSLSGALSTNSLLWQFVHSNVTASKLQELRRAQCREAVSLPTLATRQSKHSRSVSRVMLGLRVNGG